MKQLKFTKAGRYILSRRFLLHVSAVPLTGHSRSGIS